MKAILKLFCSCGAEVIRSHATQNPKCFACKKAYQKKYHQTHREKQRAAYIKKRDKLRAIRADFRGELSTGE